jgi:hypothetical protein
MLTALDPHDNNNNNNNNRTHHDLEDDRHRKFGVDKEFKW